MRDINGEESVSAMLLALLKTCPLLDDEPTFASLDDTGVAMYPLGGSAVVAQRKSITNHVWQRCSYPFAIAARDFGRNEQRKMDAKELLDNVGKWLERQAVTIDGTTYQLTEYPSLTDGRVVETIARQNTASQESVMDDGGAIWTIAISATYIAEYDEP